MEALDKGLGKAFVDGNGNALEFLEAHALGWPQHFWEPRVSFALFLPVLRFAPVVNKLEQLHKENS